MISTTARTQSSFQKDFDKYGDSYVEDTTLEGIRNIMTDVTVVTYLQ